MKLDPKLLAILACPACKGPLDGGPDASELVCRACKKSYPVVDGIPNFLA